MKLRTLSISLIVTLAMAFFVGVNSRNSRAEKGFVIEGFVSKGIYLFDAGVGDSSPLESEPIPNRVHVRWSQEFNDFVFVVADRRGRFSSPMEVLVAGSVLPGEMIGGTPDTNYKFFPGARWVATDEPKKYRFIVLYEIPRLKVVSFEPIGKHMVEFVNPQYQPNLSVINPLALR